MKKYEIDENQRETKPHNTGIRFGDNFKTYVEQFPGKGFNQKLEAMVLYCLKNEDDIEKRIENLEKDFKKKSAEFEAILQKKQVNIRELSDRENLLTSANNDLEAVNQLFERIKNNIEKLVTPSE